MTNSPIAEELVKLAITDAIVEGKIHDNADERVIRFVFSRLEAGDSCLALATMLTNASYNLLKAMRQVEARKRAENNNE